MAGLSSNDTFHPATEESDDFFSSYVIAKGRSEWSQQEDEKSHWLKDVVDNVWRYQKKSGDLGILQKAHLQTAFDATIGASKKAINFYDDLKQQGLSLPDSSAIWYAHPIKFLGHLAKIAQKKRVVIRLLITPEETLRQHAIDQATHDQWILSSTDGDYQQIKTLQDDLIAGDQYVDLLYDQLDDRKYYRLQHKNDQGTHTYFDQLSYDDLGKAPQQQNVSLPFHIVSNSGSAHPDAPSHERITLGKAKVLRVGVFFDGTGNHTGEFDKHSNIYKLSRTYLHQEFFIEEEGQGYHYCRLYIRGVGTDDASINDDGSISLDDTSIDNMLGGAAGLGSIARIRGILYDLEQEIKKYHKEYKQAPEHIIFDVFGFSRGAATARHFINVIQQKHFDFDIAHDISTYSIHFAGLFDTVGSFGLAGNDTDIGHSLHIDGSRIHQVIHLIAEDEYRANFDLTTALSDTLDTDTLQPHVIEGNIEEILIPGAHSDIGGGYPSTLSHDIGNHSLAQISLHFMYHKAREYRVPLIPIDKVIISQAPHWQKDQQCFDALSTINGLLCTYSRFTPCI